MNIKILPRGKRIGLLLSAIILWGLGEIGVIHPLLSSFGTGLCFGMIYLSLRREG